MNYFSMYVLLIFAVGKVDLNGTVDQCPNLKTSISAVRKRRHVAFPDSSTVGVTVSAVKSFMTHAPSGWFMTIEGDMSYQLPDAKFVSAQSRRKLHHRQKREFWDTINEALEFRNMNGRSCIARSVCEAKMLAPKGQSLVHDLLRIIFSVPLHEAEFNKEIGLTYNELLDPNFCDTANDCPFSLLDFVLDLNKPPK